MIAGGYRLPKASGAGSNGASEGGGRTPAPEGQRYATLDERVAFAREKHADPSINLGHKLLPDYIPIDWRPGKKLDDASERKSGDEAAP